MDTSIQATEQTEAVNPAVTKSPAEQAQDAVKIARKMKQGYNALIERELWSYLNGMTAAGVNENKKLQLKKSMVRAIQFATNFISKDMPENLATTGQLAKIENNLAAFLVKLTEANMLIMASEMEQEDNAVGANPEEGVKPLSELQESASVDGKDPVVTGPDSAE